ncbi:MAG: FxsA family protein [Kiloniellales bacterium]
MAVFLLLALILVPLLEIAVFIQVGGWIGLWPTLGLVVLAAVFGIWFLRSQGTAAFARARIEMDQGRLPARELFDGLCILVAAVLLLIPGFVTDVVGLLLLMPPFRAWLRVLLGRHFEGQVTTRVFVAGEPFEPPPGGAAGGRLGPGPIIEGDYEEVEPRGDEPGRDKR